MSDTRVCTRCSQMKPIDDFYFVSKAAGTRRGQCKPCMADLKAQQRDPDWKPSCSRCNVTMDRFGPGRRLCEGCFGQDYDLEAARDNGSHRLKLSDCSACGVKRLRGDHVKNTGLCAICRSVDPGRRTRLRMYNLNPREYVEILEAQRYRCPICNVKPSGPWHVDHDHGAPMHVRGVTCGPCNTMLALARDNSERLRRAAEYLEDPPIQALFPGRSAKPEANRSDGWSAGHRPFNRRKQS